MGVQPIRKSLAALAFVLASTTAAFVFADDTPRPLPPDTGTFYSVRMDVTYKGRPMTISYEAACNARVTKQIDGDVSVDGGAVVPMLYGVRTFDNGALVVFTPDKCENWNSDWVKQANVKPFDHPVIAYYENADKPWFGMAYLTKDAYASPLSLLKDVRSEIADSTSDRWWHWRKHDNKNFVTSELTGTNGGSAFQHKPVAEKLHRLPLACGYARLWKLSKQFSDKYMLPRMPNDNRFWYDPFTYYKLHETDFYNEYKGVSRFSQEQEIYPLRDGKATHDLTVVDGKLVMHRKDGAYAKMVDVDPNLRGFAYCDRDDQVTPVGLGFDPSSGRHAYGGADLVSNEHMPQARFGFVGKDGFVSLTAVYGSYLGGAL